MEVKVMKEELLIFGLWLAAFMLLGISLLLLAWRGFIPSW